MTRTHFQPFLCTFIEHANSVTNSISPNNLHNLNCTLTHQLPHSSFLRGSGDQVPPLALCPVTSTQEGSDTFEPMKILMQPCLSLKVFINIQKTDSVIEAFPAGSQAVIEPNW